MKKLLAILVLSLLWCNVASGQISKLYYDTLYNGCMETSANSGHSLSIQKRYCKCNADHFNKNYNDNELIELAEGRGGSAYKDVLDYVTGLCRKKVGIDY